MPVFLPDSMKTWLRTISFELNLVPVQQHIVIYFCIL